MQLVNSLKKTKLDSYPIFDAIGKSHERCLKSIIEKFPSMIFAKNNYGDPPLFEAVRTGTLNCCRIILEEAKNHRNPFDKKCRNILSWKNNREETPLLGAVEIENLGVIAKISLSSKKSINTKIILRQFYYHSIEMVQFLILNGANPIENCIRGWTAVHEGSFFLK